MAVTFKSSSSKSNARRYLVSTAKIDPTTVDDYLTQHEGKWGVFQDGGAVVPHARVRHDNTEPAATVAQIEPKAAPEAEKQPEPEPEPDPVAKAFGAFALGQLTGTAPVIAQPVRPVTAGAGIRIQQNRECRNGITRQSDGSVGAKLWAMYDIIGEACTLGEARAVAAAAGLNQTSASIAFYNWRTFNGYPKKGS